LANYFLLFHNPAEYQESAKTVSMAGRPCHIETFTSSSKQETPKVKVDMEAKLRAWLESKGKTKSIQRMDDLCNTSGVTSHLAPRLIIIIIIIIINIYKNQVKPFSLSRQRSSLRFNASFLGNLWQAKIM
jgi:hypothetical protein